MLIIANWKENKTLDESCVWFNGAKQIFGARLPTGIQVLVAPAYPLISPLQQDLLASPLLGKVDLCAQSVSHFESGAYTGEVSAIQLRGLVDYVIVGHSERRKHFNETNEQVNKKIEICIKHDLTPIVCISDLEQVRAIQTPAAYPLPLIVAYEPIFAIGSNRPDTPAHAGQVALEIKKALGENTKVLYGGSVSAENAQSFTRVESIEGLLVGQASLDIADFAGIVRATHGLGSKDH